MKNRIRYFSDHSGLFLIVAVFLTAMTLSYSLKIGKKTVELNELVLKTQAQEQHRQRQMAAFIYLHQDSETRRPLPSRFKNNPIFQIFHLLQRSS